MPCRPRADAGPCFTVHGRLFLPNGIPVQIGVPSSGRRLEVVNSSDFPPLLERYLGFEWRQIWGDWEVCPVMPDLPGVMRPVSICSASRLVVEEHPGEASRRVYRIVTTWRERSGPPRRFPFVILAEALTAPRLGEPMAFAGQRAFTTVNVDGHCRATRAAARLVGPAAPILLKKDARFTIADLGVVALDDAGAPVPPAPVHIEVEEPMSALLVLNSVDVDESVLAARAGTFRFRVRTICPGPERSLIIDARVEP